MTTKKTHAAELRLTKRAIEALTPPDDGKREYRDQEQRHLRLVVTAANRKTWRFVRKVNGRTRFYTIGTYPDVTPDQARKEARRVSAEYDAGRDPAETKKQQRKVQTWAQLFEWYMENHARPHKKSWGQDEKIEGRYCTRWRAKSYPDLTTAVITRWHKKLGANNGKKTADRALALVKTVFSKAIDTGVINGANPASPVTKFYSSPDAYGRDRFLDGGELSRFLRVLSEYPDQDMADFFTVCLFTAARRGNVQSMRWADLHRDDPERPIWKIPGTLTKNGDPVEVPLVPALLPILNSRHTKQGGAHEYVFPAKRQGRKGTPHMTEPKKAWAKVCELANLEDLRIHDLRRTMGSWQAIQGTSLPIIGKSLGHRSTQATEIYARLNDAPVRDSMTDAAAAMLKAAEDDASE